MRAPDAFWRGDGRPRVFGHRGAAASAPENTLASLRAARAAGADGVEFDVRLTADGHVVVLHDRNLARLTGRAGRLDDLPLAAVRDLRVRGEPIPVLDEWIEEAAGLALNCELKHDGAGLAGRLVAAVGAALARHDVASRTIVSSFSPWCLLRFRMAFPTVPIGLLFEDSPAGWAILRGRALLAPASIHPPARAVTAERVARWHREGRAVAVWTVNDEGQARALATSGVDALISDRPERILAALAGLALLASPGAHG